MADETTAPAGTPQPRMIRQTHKQALFTYGSTALLAMVLKGPLGEIFQTKEDAAKQSSLIAVQASQIVDLKSVMESNKTEILNAVNSVMKPVAKEVDNHETRIVNLEFIQMNKPRGK